MVFCVPVLGVVSKEVLTVEMSASQLIFWVMIFSISCFNSMTMQCLSNFTQNPGFYFEVWGGNEEILLGGAFGWWSQEYEKLQIDFRENTAISCSCYLTSYYLSDRILSTFGSARVLVASVSLILCRQWYFLKYLTRNRWRRSTFTQSTMHPNSLLSADREI